MNRYFLSIIVGAVLGGIIATGLNEPNLKAPIIKTRSCVATAASTPPRLVLPSAPRPRRRIETIAQAFRPSSIFEQERALFNLAGDADSATVQSLIFDANDIENTTNRHIAMQILIRRLTDLDPRSALALARHKDIADGRNVLQRVWQSWAIQDIESALQESAQLQSGVEKHLAAQAMISAFAYSDLENSKRVSAVTGVDANSAQREQQLFALADDSVDQAFAHVMALSPSHERRDAIRMLARYLVEKNGAGAANHAKLISTPNLHTTYLATVVGRVARHDPEGAMEILLPITSESERQQLHQVLFDEVVSRDVYLAKQLVDQMTDARARDFAYYEIIEQQARQDPVAAAGWIALISDSRVREYARRLTTPRRDRH